MRVEDFVKRADELIKLGDDVLRTKHGVGDAWGGPWVNDEPFSQFRSAALSFLHNVFSASHPYYITLEKIQNHPSPSHAEQMKGILVAARNELAGGWFRTARGLVSAEIFSDFLEMAEYFLENDYKDAAAVMVGGVLEEHLRQLAAKHKIAITTPDGKNRRAEALNEDLGKGAYSKIDQKAVTSWLAIRNAAAHAEYNKYTRDQVRNMLDGASNFIACNPL